MEVILLDKVANLGNLGDKVSVKPGYGRNYLLPSGKAASATAENIAAFEARRAELEKASTDALVVAEARKAQLDGISVVINAKAGGEGKLFGSVGNIDIAEALSTKAGVEVKKNEVRLPEGPFRTTGSFEVDLHLHSDIGVSVTVVVEDAE